MSSERPIDDYVDEYREALRKRMAERLAEARSKDRAILRTFAAAALVLVSTAGAAYGWRAAWFALAAVFYSMMLAKLYTNGLT